MEKKEYPKSEIFERAYIVKMFHNANLRKAYLLEIPPGVFLDVKRRLLIFLMQMLAKNKMEVTVGNLVMIQSQPNELLKVFLKRNQCSVLSEDEINGILFDVEIDSSEKLFDVAKDYLLDGAFTRFVTDRMSDINYYNSFNRRDYKSNIIASAKAILTVSNVLEGKRIEKRDQLQETKDMINSEDEYVSTSSQVLNGVIGGFSRRYVTSIIAKSSHGKSTWVDFNSVHTVLSKKVGRIDVITPEEDAAARWRRVLAIVFKIPTSLMRQKLAKVTDEHIKKIKELFDGKLVFHDRANKLSDVMELSQYLNTDMLVLDHLQAIDYPGRASAMDNMIGGIPGLVNFQKKLAKQKNIPIIDLSQVNDKDIMRSDRIIKAPRYWDAYGNSILYQAAREFLAFWYPYKDYEGNEMAFVGSRIPSLNDFQIGIEKSSFSGIGKLAVSFNPEIATFTDLQHKKLVKADYEPPEEKQVDMFVKD